MQQLNNPNIEFYSVEEFQERWEEMIDRVENGEHIGIKNDETGHTAVMIPSDDEIVQIYRELNNDAS